MRGHWGNYRRFKSLSQIFTNLWLLKIRNVKTVNLDCFVVCGIFMFLIFALLCQVGIDKYINNIFILLEEFKHGLSAKKKEVEDKPCRRYNLPPGEPAYRDVLHYPQIYSRERYREPGSHCQQLQVQGVSINMWTGGYFDIVLLNSSLI